MDTDKVRSMTLPAKLDDESLHVYLDRMRQIFTGMDQKYDQAATHYKFLCTGCEDNCCRTRFHHHTYLEFLYIRAGFEKLEPTGRHAIQAKAEAVCRLTAQAQKKGAAVRLMCPLNDAGLCRLYPYRPMICRLHGIPYELQTPGRSVSCGPGCGAFDEQCSGRPYFKFDRTPFYFEMAELESEFKQTIGLTGRIKLTIAEMILRMEHSVKSEGQRIWVKG
jgi:Fe-S-cluster containining protein